MSNESSLNYPIETLKEAVSIREQIAALEQRLASLFRKGSASGKRRIISPAARRRIAQAQKARWAKYRSKAPKAKISPKKRRRKVSAAARAKLSALAKRRWAAAKRAGKSSL